MFLYKEDFEKFTEGLNEAVLHIKENAPVIEARPDGDVASAAGTSDVSFEDLGS
ncbi:MAG: DUF3276 family protein [Bacteroidia bacterium]